MLTAPVGNPAAKLVLLGEAPGENEESSGVPFVGAAGQELRRCLAEAGIEDVPHRYGVPQWHEAQHVCLLNVFNERPPNNNLEAWMVGRKSLPSGYNIPAYARGKFLAPERLPHLTRLDSELACLQPNVIVALGGTALWALTGVNGISQHRGAVVPTARGKILPTFHPAAILRQWGNRPILVADLKKAWVQARTPAFNRPSRRILIQPTLKEVLDFESQHLGPVGPPISVDVETKHRQITCLSFAVSRDLGIVIPFVDETKPDNSYWDLLAERRMWRLVRSVMDGPREKIFQNGPYDAQYFLRHGIQVRNYTKDTMIRWHALYPELPKALGFQGSIMTDEPAWKLMKRQKADTVKRDE